MPKMSKVSKMPKVISRLARSEQGELLLAPYSMPHALCSMPPQIFNPSIPPTPQNQPEF